MKTKKELLREVEKKELNRLNGLTIEQVRKELREWFIELGLLVYC
jgi:hypothetical protein